MFLIKNIIIILLAIFMFFPYDMRAYILFAALILYILYIKMNYYGQRRIY